ncbi:TadE/TadG family type IV pilus assembly protein [Ruegeria atlantica]|uniref:TadE/TadG family type IV pilus assembly protein n=1 Tax=Ruegeria atlantica TaxID=81569 RepID=UPI00147D9F3D|nr:TadE/TadG family type IV pilus assembly protein [Ruegeria atlantica]
MTLRLPSPLKRLAKSDDGAILVEFGLILPLMLLMLVVTLETARIMWSYQAVIAGVRDASRYMSRVTPSDICSSGGTVTGLTTTLKGIVENDRDNNGLFPPSITVNSVTPSLTCVAGTYRVSPAPVGQVNANITIQLPMGRVLALFGDEISSITTNVSDTTRIIGQ